MPYGVKPLNDDSGRMYDCDKVYKYLIKRAIDDAGLYPIRADEQTGSHIIHSEMFKQLRDSTIVLADLSLENPNVYYELGIRHVLAPSGTILICREGTTIPFDVKLSRVIFYRFDGQDFDWDEVEKKTARLTEVLKQASTREPDSPVHAFLANVMPRSNVEKSKASDAIRKSERLNQASKMVEYHRAVARQWANEGESIGERIDEHGNSVFGARTLGELSKLVEMPVEQEREVARLLHMNHQHAMACEIYKNLEHRPGGLTPNALLVYASSISEADSSLSGADAALQKMLEAQAELTDSHSPLEHFNTHHNLAGLRWWRWRLSEDTADLDFALAHCLDTAIFANQLIASNERTNTGGVALFYLRYLLLLRLREDNRDRPDVEGHRQRVLNIDETQSSCYHESSVLRWTKAITLGDLGGEEEMRRVMMEAGVKDEMAYESAVTNQDRYINHNRTRRFIEDNLEILQHPTLLASLSQHLHRVNQTLNSA